MSLLERVVDDVLSNTRGSVRSIRLTRYFSVAETDSGEVGAAMSYYRVSDAKLEEAEKILSSIFINDVRSIAEIEAIAAKLSEIILDHEQCRFIVLSAVTAICGALSAPILMANDCRGFEVSRSNPDTWSAGAKSALVVGVGGSLEPFLETRDVEWVHTIDFLYHPDHNIFAGYLEGVRQRHPTKRITISQTIDGPEFKQFDLISITGSALCNGTIDDILASIRQDAAVIIQGQSASLLPTAFFKVGVRALVTTNKPNRLRTLAMEDRSGNAMRSLLDGHLRLIYISPQR